MLGFAVNFAHKNPSFLLCCVLSTAFFLKKGHELFSSSFISLLKTSATSSSPTTTHLSKIVVLSTAIFQQKGHDIFSCSFISLLKTTANSFLKYRGVNTALAGIISLFRIYPFVSSL